MSGPLDLTFWRERLAALPEIRSVGLSADLAAARTAPRSTPKAYVVPVSDIAASRPGAGNSVISQQINATIAVVIALSNARDSAAGSSALVDIQAVRAAIMASLVGWRPPGASTAIQYGGGQALDFEASTVWFSDRYTTTYFIRENLAP